MIVTLDFETYYDQEYTLSKLSTSEYVRDQRFEAISCGVKIGNKKTKVYFGDDIAKALNAIDWSKATLLCHHTHFDGLILSHHYGHVPKMYADTLSMARALHPKSERNSLDDVTARYPQVKHKKLNMPDFKGRHLADLTPQERDDIAVYNAGDVDATYEVFKVMFEKFPDSEMELIDITVRMFADPVLLVDMALAKKELTRERRAKNKAIKLSGATIDELSSNPKFVKKLEDLGVDIPMKTSKTDPTKSIPAVAKNDEGLQALLSHPDPKVVALVEGRLAAKSTIGESRAERMLLRGKNGMRLPIYLNYAGAHTFRWSGGDKFNPQNFKQAHKVGGKLREAIIAPPGYQLVVVDSSQIEARITAWLADEEWLLQAFRDKSDPYCLFATDAYGRPITKADKEERFVGKTCVLGLGFGMGGPKLQSSLVTTSINQGMDPVRLSLETCYGLVNTYRSKCTNIVSLWRFLNDQGIGSMLSGAEMEYKCLTFGKEHIKLPNGLSLLYPHLNANVVKKRNRWTKEATTEVIQDASFTSNKGRSKLYGGLLTENIVQALARIFVADVMVKLSRKYRIVMMTHDEIVFLAKTEDAPQAFAEAQVLMSEPPEWAPNLPVASEGGYDVCYSK